jgi:ATP-dependent exoDNAse (exonuclease V) alpha subunit
MLARTHRDVDALNELARAHGIETGQVHGPVLIDGMTEWRAGDHMRATRNNRAIAVGRDYLHNGDRFTVVSGDHAGLIVCAIDSGQTARLPADYVAAHATYGWASTIDAAQGATVDDGLLLARPGIDREHLYVGMTRGRRTNHVYVARSLIDTDRHGRGHSDQKRSAPEILADAMGPEAQKAAPRISRWRAPIGGSDGWVATSQRSTREDDYPRRVGIGDVGRDPRRGR